MDAPNFDSYLINQAGVPNLDLLTLPLPNFPLYFFPANLGTSEEEVVMEMNPQQKEFLEMSEEFSEPECSETDVLQV